MLATRPVRGRAHAKTKSQTVTNLVGGYGLTFEERGAQDIKEVPGLLAAIRSLSVTVAPHP
jgi:hypothetical protein